MLTSFEIMNSGFATTQDFSHLLRKRNALLCGRIDILETLGTHTLGTRIEKNQNHYLPVEQSDYVPMHAGWNFRVRE
jgi:hypothetical protein